MLEKIKLWLDEGKTRMIKPVPKSFEELKAIAEKRLGKGSYVYYIAKDRSKRVYLKDEESFLNLFNEDIIGANSVFTVYMRTVATGAAPPRDYSSFLANPHAAQKSSTKYSMEFVEHKLPVGNHQFQPTASVTKVWHVKNSGIYPWPSSCKLALKRGEFIFSGLVVPRANPGDYVDLSAVLYLNKQPGLHHCECILITSDKEQIGEPLHYDFHIVEQ